MPNPPTFSSFPPSFSSFPDIEDSSEKDREASSTSSQRKGLREKDEACDRKRKKRRREKHTNQNQSRTSSHERGRRDQNLEAGDYVLDNETINAEESLSRTTRQQNAQLAFFSDRKGDPLSLQYGGTYSKEVPKYRLVGCTWRLVILSEYSWCRRG